MMSRSLDRHSMYAGASLLEEAPSEESLLSLDSRKQKQKKKRRGLFSRFAASVSSLASLPSRRDAASQTDPPRPFSKHTQTEDPSNIATDPWTRFPWIPEGSNVARSPSSSPLVGGSTEDPSRRKETLEQNGELPSVQHQGYGERNPGPNLNGHPTNAHPSLKRQDPKRTTGIKYIPDTRNADPNINGYTVHHPSKGPERTSGILTPPEEGHADPEELRDAGQPLVVNRLSASPLPPALRVERTDSPVRHRVHFDDEPTNVDDSNHHNGSTNESTNPADSRQRDELTNEFTNPTDTDHRDCPTDESHHFEPPGRDDVADLDWEGLEDLLRNLDISLGDAPSPRPPAHPFPSVVRSEGDPLQGTHGTSDANLSAHRFPSDVPSSVEGGPSSSTKEPDPPLGISSNATSPSNLSPDDSRPSDQHRNIPVAAQPHVPTSEGCYDEHGPLDMTFKEYSRPPMLHWSMSAGDEVHVATSEGSIASAGPLPSPAAHRSNLSPNHSQFIPSPVQPWPDDPVLSDISSSPAALLPPIEEEEAAPSFRTPHSDLPTECTVAGPLSPPLGRTGHSEDENRWQGTVQENRGQDTRAGNTRIGHSEDRWQGMSVQENGGQDTRAGQPQIGHSEDRWQGGTVQENGRQYAGQQQELIGEEQPLFRSECVFVVSKPVDLAAPTAAVDASRVGVESSRVALPAPPSFFERPEEKERMAECDFTPCLRPSDARGGFLDKLIQGGGARNEGFQFHPPPATQSHVLNGRQPAIGGVTLLEETVLDGGDGAVVRERVFGLPVREVLREQVTTSRFRPAPPKYEGIGPTDEAGLPLAPRQMVKKENMHDWYKSMFKTLHPTDGADDSGDFVVRYSPEPPKSRAASREEESIRKGRALRDASPPQHKPSVKPISQDEKTQPTKPFLQFQVGPDKHRDSNRTPPTGSELRAAVLFPFRAMHDNELPLSAGDEVVVRRRVDANWFEGELRGRRGIFPANHVQVILDREVEGRALYDFAPQSPLEIALQKGEEVRVLRAVDPNWWSVRRRGGEEGLAPAAHIALRTGSPGPSLRTPSASRGASPQLAENMLIEPMMCVAVWDYSPSRADELALCAGDRVCVMERCADGWCRGTSARTHQIGLFPGNYVQPLQEN